MAYPRVSPLSAARMQPLVFSIVTLLGLSAPAAMAATAWPVTTCDDSGAGSLRAVIGAATTVSGDTVDMSMLACSVISLHTGAITIPQNTLTIIGPTASTVTVTGMYNGAVEKDRLFKHTGNGTLYLTSFDMQYGDVETTTTPAVGGCVFSSGVAELDHVRIRYCTAHSDSGAAKGGAIYSFDVGMNYSNVSFSSASSISGAAYGGGVFGRHNVVAKYSTIDSNVASSTVKSVGGGILSEYGVDLKHSTVSNNYSKFIGGGIALIGVSQFSDAYLKLESSTVANNSAGQYTGGIITIAKIAALYNSTIVNNSAASGNAGDAYGARFYAPGLTAGNGITVLTMQSSLLTNNTYGGGLFENDLSLARKYGLLISAASANNLVGAVGKNQSLPDDTIIGSCPKLGRLRDNGGLTQTVALLSHSIAIDKGNNSKNESYDQRGFTPSPWLYPRVSQATAPDIGAYEVNGADIVFNADFENCPLLL